MLFNYFGVVIGKPAIWEEFAENITLNAIEINNRTGKLLEVASKIFIF